MVNSYHLCYILKLNKKKNLKEMSNTKKVGNLQYSTKYRYSISFLVTKLGQKVHAIKGIYLKNIFMNISFLKKFQNTNISFWVIQNQNHRSKKYRVYEYNWP